MVAILICMTLLLLSSSAANSRMTQLAIERHLLTRWNESLCQEKTDRDLCASPAAFPALLIAEILSFAHNVPLRRPVGHHQTVRGLQRLLLRSAAAVGSSLLCEASMCDHSTAYIRPLRGKTADSKYRFIIDAQEVRIEKCLSPGQECSLNGGGNGFGDLGVETVCRQKYSQLEMLALTEAGEVERNMFRFPSGCACKQMIRTSFTAECEAL